MNTTTLFTIQGIPAISATRLEGGWVLQLPYGAAARPATAEEFALIEATWDGDTDGCGNDWHLLSTPLDIAPLALPDPPAEIYLPMPAEEFIALVRAGKVRAETPDGDTSRVQINRAGDGWATRIGWDYELYDDVAVDYESFHESMTIDSDTHLQRHDDKVIVGSETFLITQP